MRVVAGTVGGRRLEVPAGSRADVRPTAERIRSAIFNSLTSLDVLEGARVLDLFAGSGALGIEALSRGAAWATFVDANRRSVAAIRQNLKTLRLEGSATVVCRDVMRWVRAAGAHDASGHVALVDPPYAFDGWSELLSGLHVALAVCESDHSVDAPRGWEVVRIKRHGGTVVTLLKSQGLPLR